MNFWGKIKPMSSALQALMGLLAVMSLLGCPVMAPQAGAPTSAQKEDTAGASSSSSENKGEDVPSNVGTPPTGDPAAAVPPPVAGNPPEYADAGAAKPQQGGVSAIPVAPPGSDGGETLTPFNFTLTGTAQPLCVESSSSKNAFSPLLSKTHYRISGAVGAALLDGTVVPLVGCERLRLRLQTGPDEMAQCEDIPVNADCGFLRVVALRLEGRQPKDLLFLHHNDLEDPLCGDMHGRGIELLPDDMTFVKASENLPECTPKNLPIKMNIPFP
jgi:hypothetical protein